MKKPFITMADHCKLEGKREGKRELIAKVIESKFSDQSAEDIQKLLGKLRTDEEFEAFIELVMAAKTSNELWS